MTPPVNLSYVDQEPLYRQIADKLRRQITSGEYAPGAQLPSRPELMRAHGVSDAVAKQAIGVLVAEGLAVAKPGSGTYVRERPQLTRLVRAWYSGVRKGSPFAAQMEAEGKRGSWDYESSTAHAPAPIRTRLDLPEPADEKNDVLRTRYVFKADGVPVMLSTSWEPLDITRGTAIVLPEEGPHAGRGVQERMLAIGRAVDAWIETVGARPSTADEAAALQVPAGSVVLTIERTFQSGDRFVETADIVLIADRFQLVYSGRAGEHTSPIGE
ncbi:DNA-binding transcriptional regulator, GntR family [Sinosporangium album]|uniref:DNA-binding transcriptional regulator, GntR family n=1 Tax=Sinosporangium album TaxID=504805 RepID=A0A1G8FMM4_9ACTN|nr:GntR family transcriptional regulator [Sinosporangium album]SDH83362.1 DNA-binding transcriptional regulator, GntR family [Sinosporangium album]